MSKEISVKDCEKIRDAIISLVDALENDNMLIKNQRVEEAARSLEEKQALLEIFSQHVDEISAIVKGEVLVQNKEHRKLLDQVKVVVEQGMKIVQENMALVFDKLYVLNATISSLKSVVEEKEHNLNLYGVHGKRLRSAGKKSEALSILLDSKV